MKRDDKKFLQIAMTLAKKCTPISTAYCVGAVVVDSKNEIISTGFSREDDRHKHAEEIAIERALKAQDDLKDCTLYSSLEPCGERLSGKKTCVARITETGIKRVVFGAYEPEKFVKGKGAKLLKQAGVTTVYLETKDNLALQ